MSLDEIYNDPDLYDAEFSSRLDDIVFYCEVLQERSGSILEIGCGSGRLTIPIAQLDKDITGLDLVPRMIEQARLSAEKAGLEIPFLVGDCRSFDLNKRFDTIICAANTAQHLLTDAEIEKMLTCTLAHADPESALYLEVFNPNPTRLTSSDWHHKKSFTLDDKKIEVWCKSSYMSCTQVLDFSYSYRSSGEEFHKKEISIRCFPQAHLSELIESSGWIVEDCYGDYGLSVFRQDSPLQIFRCRSAW